MKRGSLVEKLCSLFYCSSQSEVENYMRLWKLLVGHIELGGISDLSTQTDEPGTYAFAFQYPIQFRPREKKRQGGSSNLASFLNMLKNQATA